MLSENATDYKLRSVIFAGAAGALAVSLFFVSIWFLMSRTDYGHLSIISDTVNEMMAYAMFFLLVFASYFIAALAVHYFRERLKGRVPAWLAVSVLGSLLFTAALLTLVNFSLHGFGEIAKTSIFYVITLSVAAGVFSRAIEFLSERQSRMSGVSNKL